MKGGSIVKYGLVLTYFFLRNKLSLDTGLWCLSSSTYSTVGHDNIVPIRRQVASFE